MSRLAKMVAVVMAGVMVSGMAMAEGKKHKEGGGPSEKETVEFINGLLACDRPHAPNIQVNSDTLAHGGSQRSALIYSAKGSGELKADVNDFHSAFGRCNSGSCLLSIGLAKTSLVVIPWGELEQINDANGSDLILRCNPTNGSCLQLSSKEIQERHSEAGNRIISNDCTGDAEGCLKVAKEALPNQPFTRENVSSYTINFCRPEDATRAVKAINHLIQMNGGKKSLF